MTGIWQRAAAGILAAWLGAAGWASAAEVPLDGMLDPGGGLWALDAKAFMEAYGRAGFRWTSDTDRSLAQAYRQPLALRGFPVCEAQVRFAGGQAAEATVYLFNRAEGGDMDRAAFDGLAAKAAQSLSQWAGREPVAPKEETRASGGRVVERAWVAGPHQVKLEGSYSRPREAGEGVFRAEYLRVVLTPNDASRSAGQKLLAERQERGGGSVSGAALTGHVRREADGDVWIDGIPMVYQGERGYCMVATAERIMRYYGIDLDQHEFAQLAMTSAQSGTDPRTLKDVLVRAGFKLGCRILTHLEFDYRDFDNLIEDYNRLAKRQKQAPVTVNERLIDVDHLYGQMDLALLKEVRLKRAAEFKRFQADVAEQVQKGIPLIWGVRVGLVTETPAVIGAGGHARLIIGYNAKASELLYSDSWGPGHEKKRMALDSAWTITTALYTIEPRKTSR